MKKLLTLLWPVLIGMSACTMPALAQKKSEKKSDVILSKIDSLKKFVAAVPASQGIDFKGACKEETMSAPDYVIWYGMYFPNDKTAIYQVGFFQSPSFRFPFGYVTFNKVTFYPDWIFR